MASGFEADYQSSAVFYDYNVINEIDDDLTSDDSKHSEYYNDSNTVKNNNNPTNTVKNHNNPTNTVKNNVTNTVKNNNNVKNPVINDNIRITFDANKRVLEITIDDDIRNKYGYIFCWCLHILMRKQIALRGKYFMKARYSWNDKINNIDYNKFEFINNGLRLDLPDIHFQCKDFVMFIFNILSMIQMYTQHGSNYFQWVSNTFLQIHFYNNAILDEHIDNMLMFWDTTILRIGNGDLRYGKRSIGPGCPGHCAVFTVDQISGYVLIMGRGIIDNIKHGVLKQKVISLIGRKWQPFLIPKGVWFFLLSCYTHKFDKEYWDILSYLVLLYSLKRR